MTKQQLAAKNRLGHRGRIMVLPSPRATLAGATLLTLVVIPTLYYAVYRRRYEAALA